MTEITANYDETWKELITEYFDCKINNPDGNGFDIKTLVILNNP